MIKKILLVFTAILLVSCGSGKSTASRSSKPVYRKPSTSVAARKTPYKKPVQKAVTKSAHHDNPAPTEVLQATSKVKVTNDVILDYINEYKEIAKSNMAKYGIPSSITLAQGILESGAGTGTLSMRANNHFGIKCHTGWTGESVRHDDDSAQECFRKYSRAAESYNDHSLFLTGRSRYSSLFQLDKADYKAWAKGLRSAGYATDPKYPDKLIGLIERFQLDRFDAEVLGKNYAPDRSVAMVASADTYEVNPGDTLYSISKKFNLTVDELKRKNNMHDNALSIGQFLKIK